MTIEFECPQCGRTLRTSDDKSGHEASCPGCETPVTVPSPKLAGSVANEAVANGSRPANESKLCPECCERMNAAATCCPHCGAVVGRTSAPIEPFSYIKPHRAPVLLSMSIFSWVACFACACCFLVGIAGAGTAAVTIVLANHDLKEMTEGIMDSSGLGMTRVARMTAIVQLVLGAIVAAIYMTVLFDSLLGNNLRSALGF